MAFNAGTLESSMPTAVLATSLATEYEAEPAFVFTAVFVSTRLSPLTMKPLLLILGARVLQHLHAGTTLGWILRL